MKRLVAPICVVFLVAACRAHPLEWARQQVSIGTSREEAVRILGDQAWYHQPCGDQDNNDVIEDLFFYGDHRYDKADIVIVTSVIEGGAYRVVRISSFESYAWHTAYKDCIQRDKFED